MKVIRKINNNVAIGLDKDQREVVIFGNGVGFGVMPNELTDLTKIERTFYNIDSRYYGLLNEIPENIFLIVTRLLDIAKSKIGGDWNPNVVFILADHIHFAVERYRKGISIPLPYSYELEYEHPELTDVAKWFIRKINEDLHVTLGMDEVTSITMHLINAQGVRETQTEQKYSPQRIALVIQDITDIVEAFFQIKGFFVNLFNVFSACFSPLVPLFVAVGIFNMVAVLIGPQFFKLVTEDSSIYKNFYFVAQSILYFMPILVAYTAARRFKSNPLIAIALAGLLIYPKFLEMVTAGSAYTVYGIPVAMIDYSSSIIPIMLIVWIQSYIEKLLNKYVPEVVKVILIPCGTILIMMPLALCLLGPAGNYIGVGLGKLLYGLYAVAGPVATLAYGAIAVIGVALGFTRPIFFIAMTALFASGVEYAVMPMSMVYLNWVVMGTILGYVVKSKGAKEKQFGITCFASNFLGGVSEPSIFGIIFNNRKLLIPGIVAGAAAGLYSGIMKVGYYAFGPSNFLGVIGFLGGEQSNFVNGCIASGIGLVVAFLVTLFVYREKKIQ